MIEEQSLREQGKNLNPPNPITNLVGSNHTGPEQPRYVRGMSGVIGERERPSADVVTV